jgi:hypothetical protein
MAQVHPAPDSIATGQGAGGSGGGGKRPDRPGGPEGHRYDRNWLIALSMCCNNRSLTCADTFPVQNAIKLDLETLRRIRRALITLYQSDPDLKGAPASLRGRDVRRLIQSNQNALRPTDEVPYRRSGHTFNLRPSGNANYLSSALIHTVPARTVHAGTSACTRCQRGSGPFSECVTLTFDGHEYLKGACTNCGYGNHFEACDFSCKSYWNMSKDDGWLTLLQPTSLALALNIRHRPQSLSPAGLVLLHLAVRPVDSLEWGG